MQYKVIDYEQWGYSLSLISPYWDESLCLTLEALFDEDVTFRSWDHSPRVQEKYQTFRSQLWTSLSSYLMDLLCLRLVGAVGARRNVRSSYSPWGPAVTCWWPSAVTCWWPSAVTTELSMWRDLEPRFFLPIDQTCYPSLQHLANLNTAI